MKKVRVLLADSHSEVRIRLATRLQREPDIELVGQASTSAQALRSALAKEPDVLLIDPIMPDGFGLANLRQMIARLPKMATIILTAYVDTSLRMELNRMGVVQIFSKGLASEYLVDAIRQVGEITPTHSIDG